MWCAVPIVLVVLTPVERLEVTIAVTKESRLIQCEFERDWSQFGRTVDEQLACLRWERRKNGVLYQWNVRFIDGYDARHPGYTAAQFGRLAKWERLTPDWWLRTGAPIEWMEWRQQCWLQEHERADGWGEVFGAEMQEYDDPVRQPLPPPPWVAEFWNANQEYGP